MLDVVSLTLLGIIQGLTEFIPVSSTGHLILARDVFALSGEYGLAVDAVLQLATACAVLVYFWKDIRTFLLGGERNTVLAILVGTVPAVILGLMLEDSMETVFRSAHLVAYALLVGSAVMFAAEYWPHKLSPGAMTPWKGLVVGLFQSLALVPGMSRSGMTISGGMLLGLTRAEAARFGFLLSLPILFGTGLKKLLDLSSTGILADIGTPLLIGSVASFLSGLIAIYLVLSIVRRAPLTWFVGYRVLLAAAILIFI